MQMQHCTSALERISVHDYQVLYTGRRSFAIAYYSRPNASTRVVDRGRVLVPCWVKERAIIFSWKAAGTAGAETFAEVHVSGIGSQMQADSVYSQQASR